MKYSGELPTTQSSGRTVNRARLGNALLRHPLGRGACHSATVGSPTTRTLKGPPRNGGYRGGSDSARRSPHPVPFTAKHGLIMVGADTATQVWPWCEARSV